MKIEIRSRFGGPVLFDGEFGSITLAVEAAVQSMADLAGAYLSGAYLGHDQMATIPPMFLSADGYTAMVTDRHIKIGCKIKKTDDWADVTAEKIATEHGALAVVSWTVWRDTLIAV